MYTEDKERVYLHESRKVMKTKKDKECAGNDTGLSW